MTDLPNISIDFSHLEAGLKLLIDERKNNTIFDVNDAIENNEARDFISTISISSPNDQMLTLVGFIRGIHPIFNPLLRISDDLKSPTTSSAMTRRI